MATEQERAVISPKVAVIVLNWNGGVDTIDCLASLRALDYPNFFIAIVDNGSTDNSVAAIGKAFPDLEILQTGGNLGYAGGNNFGMRHALEKQADYVLILNNDVVVSPRLLSALISEAVCRSDGGMWGAKVLSYENPQIILYAGSTEDQRRAVYGFVGAGEVDDGVRYGDLVETRFVHGAAFLIRSDVVRKVGLMDERFFLYYEETEWCSRIRESGYKLFYVPGATVWHKDSKSTGGWGSPLQRYFWARNHLLWAEMHTPFSAWMGLLFHLGWLVVFPLSEIRFRDILADQRRFYWTSLTWLRRVYQQWREPTHWAFAIGFRDYVLRRLGDCPACVRRWNEANRS